MHSVSARPIPETYRVVLSVNEVKTREKVFTRAQTMLQSSVPSRVFAVSLMTNRPATTRPDTITMTTVTIQSSHPRSGCCEVPCPMFVKVAMTAEKWFGNHLVSNSITATHKAVEEVMLERDVNQDRPERDRRHNRMATATLKKAIYCPAKSLKSYLVSGTSLPWHESGRGNPNHYKSATKLALVELRVTVTRYYRKGQRKETKVGTRNNDPRQCFCGTRR